MRVGRNRTVPSAQIVIALLLVIAMLPAAATVVAPPPWYLSWTNGLCAGLSSAAAELPGDGGELLPGLAIGDTTVTCTVSNTAQTCSDLTHTVIYAAGDLISVREVQNNNPDNSAGQWTATYQP